MSDWTYRQGGGHATFFVEGPTPRGPWLIAEVSGRTLEENERHARLIAAAPDLLEAAARVLMNLPTTVNPDPPGFYEALAALRAAVAKATGDET